MNWQPLAGIFAFLYAGFVAYVGVTKKPESVWDMAKVRFFRKILGEKGAQIFFIIWAIIFVGLGIWAFMLTPEM